MNRYVVIAYLLFVIVNGADVISTLIGLQLGARESDQETLQLMQQLGVVPALLLKFFLVVSVGLIAVWYQGKSTLDPRFFLAGFGIGILFYIPLLYRNLRIILYLMGVL